MENFKRKYFDYNSQMLYAIKGLEFMLFRRGGVTLLKRKNEFIEKYYKYLQKEFDENKNLVLPKLDFIITTRCTLRCKDCSSMIPKYSHHIELSFEDFKRDIDVILNNVIELSLINFSGGEPLLNKDLSKMIDYAASKQKVGMIKIITNGTLIPNDELICAVKKHNDKVFFFISNYSVNPDLKPKLKTQEIIELLSKNNIKYQMIKDFTWFEEKEMQKQKLNCKDDDSSGVDKYIKQMYENCILSACLGVFNHRLHTCPKASHGEQLGIFYDKDAIDLTDLKDDDSGFKEKFIEFYKKDFYEPCRYCIRSNKEVMPAKQL